jgi:hypothetical protein
LIGPVALAAAGAGAAAGAPDWSIGADIVFERGYQKEVDGIKMDRMVYQ